jgi:fructan beta-fructosidase
MNIRNPFTLAPCLFALTIPLLVEAQSQPSLDSLWRPQIHFSAKANWINDPNGMVYDKGVYHLFYQHHPASPVWGPMHWGHATSKDLVRWEEQPIKLYPDSLGYIFSGSAVVDKENTSGFGTRDNPPLVAVFTHHDPKSEKTSNTFQVQSIAYSLDDGRTWTKYAGNPVLKNPGIVDFRDPKVMWHDASKRWIMTLATKDCITFYSSPDLKDWTRETDFGKKAGAHGGVWECPDLFTLEYDGKTYWVLLVSINPGGPNGGSATQYFIGDFDGKKFTASHEDIRWLDYGPDNYAGVTWSNTGNRRIFIGWMSNWDYANNLPSQQWRNAMTIARELRLEKAGDKMVVASRPVPELQASRVLTRSQENQEISAGRPLKIAVPGPGKAWQIELETASGKDFHIRLMNDLGEELMVGYNSLQNMYYMDRGLSGQVNSVQNFSRKITAPRLASGGTVRLSLWVDASSAELFADDGLTVMTTVYFPRKPFREAVIGSPDRMKIRKLIWSSLQTPGLAGQ